MFETISQFEGPIDVRMTQSDYVDAGGEADILGLTTTAFATATSCTKPILEWFKN